MVTAARIPPGRDAEEFLTALRALGGLASAGFGQIPDQLVRLDHTGRNDNPDRVHANLKAYKGAIQA